MRANAAVAVTVTVTVVLGLAIAGPRRASASGLWEGEEILSSLPMAGTATGRNRNRV